MSWWPLFSSLTRTSSCFHKPRLCTCSIKNLVGTTYASLHINGSEYQIMNKISPISFSCITKQTVYRTSQLTRNNILFQRASCIRSFARNFWCGGSSESAPLNRQQNIRQSKGSYHLHQQHRCLRRTLRRHSAQVPQMPPPPRQHPQPQ